MTSILEKYPETAALLALANEAANRLQTLWFGFLGFGAFIVAAAWSASHRDLFLENPISLPLLNLNLPLTSFFVAAPFLMVILHFYLIVKLVLLARAFHLYEKAGKREISYAGEHRQFGQHINTSVFLQALYNDPDRHLVATFSLRVVIVLTIMALPLLALVLVQAQFLPHQSAWITNAHRIYITLDILAIAVGWTSVKNIGTLGKFKVRYGGPLALLAAAMVLTISTLFLTFPGELFDNNLVARQIPGRSATIGPLHTTSVYKHFGLFPATLQLAGEDFVDNNDIDLDKVKETVNLRARSLIGANLRETDLEEANFDGANLIGAELNRANLNRAQLKYDNISERITILQGASLSGARLQGASLNGARLQGASLDFARLQGASLDFARLQGASLNVASLQGASLNGARLQGASLNFADFTQAALNSTFMWRSHGTVKNSQHAKIHKLRWIPLADYDNWLKKVLAGIGDYKTKKRIRDRTAILKPDARTPKQDLANKQHWSTLAAKSPSNANYRAGLAKFLQTLACESNNNNFVAESLIVAPFFFSTSRVESLGKAGNDLMNTLLGAAENPKSAIAKACPGAVGLSDKAKNNLRKWLAKNKT